MTSLALLVQGAVRSTAEERFELLGVGFADAWFLLLAPLAWLLIWRQARRRAAAVVPTLGPGTSAAARPGPAARLGAAAALLTRLAAVTLVVIALARPLEGRDMTTRETEGIDISLVIDRSSSMEERESAGEPRRFDIVRRVVADFAARRMTDEEGARDNVALTGFAGYSELLVPFTLDVDALLTALGETEVELERSLDGTAIGAALAQAVAVLKDSGAKSKVVVLLTDGRETVHRIDAIDVAEAAAELGIRIYTVFAGKREIRGRSIFGDVRTEKVPVGDLPEIAEITGARFFHADGTKELEAAYAEIEALERTPRVEDSFRERYDLYPRLLLPGLALYVLGWALAAVAGRRLP